mgnify:CR=1 FL=1
MFSLINYARFIKIDPDMALRKSNKKFVDRFKYMEKEIKLKNKCKLEMPQHILWAWL